MSYTDDTLQASAQRVANVYARLVNRILGCTIPVPVPIKFGIELESKKMASWAGYAYDDSLMGINMTLLRENPEHMLNTTIPHEIAHMVQFQKFTDKGMANSVHGVFWKEVMRTIGKANPEKCHTLDVTSAIEAYHNHKAAKKKKK